MVCLAIKTFFCYGGGGEWGGGRLIIVHVFAGCTLHCIPCCQSLFFWGERSTILHVFCGMHIAVYTMLSEPFLLEGRINNPSCVLWDAHSLYTMLSEPLFFYIPPLPPLPLHPLKCMLCQATEVVIFLYSCAIHLLPHVVTLKKIKIIEMFLEINCLFSCPDITALVDWA